MPRLEHLLSTHNPLVMGVLNVTPDSFSDGGHFYSPDLAIEHAMEMISEGADIIDVGGESTRPNAAPVAAEEELERILPVIRGIRERSDICISVDTSAPLVMRAMGDEDVDLVNDVRALGVDGALEAALNLDLPVCLMHMKGNPRTMQLNPEYDDLMVEINQFFEQRIEACGAAGISRSKLLLDPGFGFGKLPEHNLRVINRLSECQSHGLPLLVGLSRKSTIGRITDNLLIGSVVGALAAIANGARIVRVHDVAETVSAIRMTRSLEKELVVEK